MLSSAATYYPGPQLIAWWSLLLLSPGGCRLSIAHDDVIKWKHFPRYLPFVWGIHRSLVNSPRKGQWRGALMFSLICAWINPWVNNQEAGEFRRHRAHYDVIVLWVCAYLAATTCYLATASYVIATAACYLATNTWIFHHLGLYLWSCILNVFNIRIMFPLFRT